jgi:hypothetical protein
LRTTIQSSQNSPNSLPTSVIGPNRGFKAEGFMCRQS